MLRHSCEYIFKMQFQTSILYLPGINQHRIISHGCKWPHFIWFIAFLLIWSHSEDSKVVELLLILRGVVDESFLNIWREQKLYFLECRQYLSEICPMMPVSGTLRIFSANMAKSNKYGWEIDLDSSIFEASAMQKMQSEILMGNECVANVSD